MLILGITGQTGSGKDAICRFIQDNVESVSFVRFSQALTEALSLFVQDIKKEDQQWLGNVLRERFGADIIAKSVAKKIENSKTEIVILNGIRYQVELELLKSFNGKLIYVSAPANTRWERVLNRGEKKDDNSSFEKFQELDSAPTEKGIIEIAQQADFVIENNGTYDQLMQKVREVLKELQIPIKIKSVNLENTVKTSNGESIETRDI